MGVVSFKSLECLCVFNGIIYSETRQISFLGHKLRLSDGELVKDLCALYFTSWQELTRETA